MIEIGRGAWASGSSRWVLTMEYRMAACYPMGRDAPGAFDLVWLLRDMEEPRDMDQVFETKDEAFDVLRFHDAREKMLPAICNGRRY